MVSFKIYEVDSTAGGCFDLDDIILFGEITFVLSLNMFIFLYMLCFIKFWNIEIVNVILTCIGLILFVNFVPCILFAIYLKRTLLMSRINTTSTTCVPYYRKCWICLNNTVSFVHFDFIKISEFNIIKYMAFSSCSHELITLFVLILTEFD